MRLLPMGERAVIVAELDADPAAWAGGLRAAGLPGVVEIVPAAETVLVACGDAVALRQTLAALDRIVPIDDSVREPDVVEIGVDYDGADLAWVADACGVTESQVIALHSATEYTVAFCGFAPGFGYLRGLDPRLHLPRRATPRAAVPSGSVAIAAEFAAVYPRSSPGGWHLLGRTELSLFDPDRDPPSLVAPGTRVRFVPR